MAGETDALNRRTPILCWETREGISQRANLAKTIRMLLRAVLGCVFLMSALPKLQQPYDFLHVVYGLRNVINNVKKR